MLSHIDSNSKRISEVIKIHFSIEKKVEFGRGVYVVGDHACLGEWMVANGLRLSWSEGDEWSGYAIVDRNSSRELQFKYLVSDYEHPSNLKCQWEQGVHNRILSLEYHRNSLVCSHKWNFDKVTLILFVDQPDINHEYFVSGSIPQLGSWKSKKQMKYVHVKDFSPSKTRQAKSFERELGQNAFDYSFYVHRSQKTIQYYYIKKGSEVEKERNPKRTLQINNLKNNRHPECLSINYHLGDVQIYETCQFNQLHLSQITDHIFVGAYLRNKQDFEKLKENNINAVLSIQTKEDYNSHCLSTHYLKLLCEQHGIKYHAYSIKDNNIQDFVDKGMGAFLLLRKLIVDDKLKVYVHCSAGMYRSPQVIVLYLVLVLNESLQDAIKKVTEKHPFAKPNYNVLNETIKEIKNKLRQQ